MSAEIKIEKDVPVPKRRGPGWNAKYPWDDMEIGDSFFLPNAKNNSLNLAASANKRYAPKRFTARTVDGGVRVWRFE